MRGRGEPITDAVDVPGGPILAGDHRRRDRSSSGPGTLSSARVDLASPPL